jgi:hypothetical protein
MEIVWEVVERQRWERDGEVTITMERRVERDGERERETERERWIREGEAKREIEGEISPW